MAGFVGVLIMLQPGIGMVKLAGLAALLGAACQACLGVLLKKVAANEGAITTIFWSFFCGFLVSGMLCGFKFPSAISHVWILLALASVASLCVFSAYIAGYRAGEASIVEAGSYTIVIFSALLDFMVFWNVPGGVFWLGVIVLIGGLLIVSNSTLSR